MLYFIICFSVVSDGSFVLPFNTREPPPVCTKKVSKILLKNKAILLAVLLALDSYNNRKDKVGSVGCRF